MILLVLKRNGEEFVKMYKMNKLQSQLLITFKTSKLKKSHYSRADTRRPDLPPGLSINLMYNHWKNEMIKNNQKFSSFSKYCLIFTTKFNIGFGHPRQDLCGY